MQAYAVFVLTLLIVGTMSVGAAADKSSQPKPMVEGKIFFNEDDSARFLLTPPGKTTAATLDECIDGLENTQVRVFDICCCAQQTNFPSKAWEAFCTGFDPSKGNDQPFFKGVEPPMIPSFRKWAENMAVLFQQGIDPTGYLIDRCREKGISPWVSMRMNDIHDVQHIDSPIHSRFWRDHPEYWRHRDRFKSWPDRALDYGKKPVRDHAMALIREICDRYDMDGLELDWLRFPYHFREGEEIEKGKELTEWIGEVRGIVNNAAKKRGHKILLIVRVPSQPKVAYGIGLDAAEWAKRGYIDRVIVSPFWATTDFDIPVEKWLELLKGTGVPVTAGLEARVQPYPGSATLPNTPERKRGAAMAALARGSDGIYLFNYMGEQHRTPFLFKELGSARTLEGKSRTHVLTYPDIYIPNKREAAPLPKMLSPGQATKFKIYTGPVPHGARTEIHVAFDKTFKAENAPEVRMNGARAEAASNFHESQFDFCSYSIPEKNLIEGYQTIELRNNTSIKIKVTAMEIAIVY